MSDGIDTGCVRLRLAVVDGRVGSVSVASERPLVAAVLRGRPADAAMKLVPLLFALCGKAQGRAAELALAAARGGECAAHTDPAVQAEAMREHLWRWLLDLPPLLGEAADQAEFARLARDMGAGRRDGVADFLEGERIARLCRRLKEMDDPVGTPGRLLPCLDATASLRLWPQLDAGFCTRPQWQGSAAETKPENRVHSSVRRSRAGGHGIAVDGWPNSPASPARWTRSLRSAKSRRPSRFVDTPTGRV